jgi:hypothetical protein
VAEPSETVKLVGFHVFFLFVLFIPVITSLLARQVKCPHCGRCLLPQGAKLHIKSCSLKQQVEKLRKAHTLDRVWGRHEPPLKKIKKEEDEKKEIIVPREPRAGEVCAGEGDDVNAGIKNDTTKDDDDFDADALLAELNALEGGNKGFF